MYELCALKPPFMAKDFPGLCKKVTLGFYDAISEIYSKKLAYVIKKCLTVDISKRPTV
jgi:NIMA (never in mitosis gene a)-related kinase